VVIPLLFMGSLLTESFFGIPGLGSYTIDAINAQDFGKLDGLHRFGALHRRSDPDRHFLHPGRPADTLRMMGFQIVLWSDILIWLLVAAGIAVGVLIAKLAPARRLAPGRRQPGHGLATGLLAFILIGLLDSLHYRVQLRQAGAEGELRDRGAVGARRAGRTLAPAQ
jgi:hypothetical protein